MIYENFSAQRIRNPIFFYPALCVQIQLVNMVVAGCAGENNFDNPVRRSATSVVSKFVRVTDNTYIRFNDGFIIIKQLDRKGGRVNLTISFFSVNVIGNLLK